MPISKAEKILIEAILKHRIVRLKYKNEYFSRSFEPYIIYRSPANSRRILVSGIQTKNDSKPLESSSPHKFEVNLISSLSITDSVFEYDFQFDIADEEYRNGIIFLIRSDALTV